MPTDGKKVKEKKRKLNPKSVYRFYWGLLITAGILMCLLSVPWITQSNETSPCLTYGPSCVWLLALSIVFFDTVNIIYLQITCDYWLLAKKVMENGYWEKFRILCILSGFLTLINVMLIFINFSFILAITTICAGWLITGIIRYIRFVFYKS